MLASIHKNKLGRTVVAVCDKSLIGKKLEEGSFQLDLSADFYKGEEKAVELIADVIRNADIVNLVGEKSINLGLKEGIVEKSDIKQIQGTPHAQVLLSD
jgi:uncharacterized protein